MASAQACICRYTYVCSVSSIDQPRGFVARLLSNASAAGSYVLTAANGCKIQLDNRDRPRASLTECLFAPLLLSRGLSLYGWPILQVLATIIPTRMNWTVEPPKPVS